MEHAQEDVAFRGCLCVGRGLHTRGRMMCIGRAIIRASCALLAGVAVWSVNAGLPCVHS